jgi:hypothetical protein
MGFRPGTAIGRHHSAEHVFIFLANRRRSEQLFRPDDKTQGKYDSLEDIAGIRIALMRILASASSTAQLASLPDSGDPAAPLNSTKMLSFILRNH